MNAKNRTLARLQCKLDKQAIEQLRGEVNRLQFEIEHLQKRIDQAEQHAADAERMADMWQYLLHQSDQQIGLMNDGTIGIMEAPQ